MVDDNVGSDVCLYQLKWWILKYESWFLLKWVDPNVVISRYSVAYSTHKDKTGKSILYNQYLTIRVWFYFTLGIHWSSNVMMSVQLVRKTSSLYNLWVIYVEDISIGYDVHGWLMGYIDVVFVRSCFYISSYIIFF